MYGSKIIVVILLILSNVSFSQDELEKYERLGDSCVKYVFNPCNSAAFVHEADSIAMENSIDASWKVLMAKAWVFYEKKNYDSVYECIDRLSEFVDSSDTTINQFILLRNIANLQLNNHNFSNAGKSFQKLKDLAIAANDTFYYVKSNWGLQSVATQTEDFHKAREYLDELQEYFGDEASIPKADTYLYYAGNALKHKDYETAISSIKSALKLFYELNYFESMATAYNQLGCVYMRLNKNDSCMWSYKKCLELSRDKDSRFAGDSYGNIGYLYFLEGDYENAIAYFDSVKIIGYQTENERYIKFSYQYLARAYDSLGDYKKAYESYKQYSIVNDSTRRKEIEQLYVEERTRFETEVKTRELEMVSIRLRNQQIIFIASISLALLIIIVIFLLYRQGKLRDRQRISEFERKLAETRQLSLRQQMNPHFIFNTLNSIQYFMFRNDKMATNSYMNKFAMLVRKTLDNSQHNSVSLKNELEALKLYIELEQLRFKNSFVFEIDVDEEIDVLQHRVPTMIIQPFVENAINHGLHSVISNGKLSICLNLVNNDIIECVVEDNGIGRKKAAEIKKLKQKNHNSLGTTITRERLKIIDLLVDNNLKINYDDLEDLDGNPAGTCVTISIPVITSIE